MRRGFSLGKCVVYLLLCLWAATTLFPFVWVVNNSFKTSNLVVSDSFTPATKTIYEFDKHGQIVHAAIQKDAHGRDMYDRYLYDERGEIVLEKDKSVSTLAGNDAFTSLLGGMNQAAPDAETGELPAYDTVLGKPVYDMDSKPVKQSPTLENYVTAFTNPNVAILSGYRNSLIVSGSVMLATMLMATMIAFALNRFRFRGRAVVEWLIVAALMFPDFSTIVPVYRMLSGLGLFNTLQGVILVQIAGNLAFATTVMSGFVRQLPYDLEEAAFMEGCGVYRIFAYIILPLARPALSTVAIFTFIWSYNNLFVQMVLLRSKSLMPVCAILREISSQYGTDFGLMAAAVAIVVIPVLILYMLLQKNIIKGLTAGAVKG